MLTLQDDDKPMRHTHEFEVKGDVLFMRCKFASAMISRRRPTPYGKTIHFWQVDRGDGLPISLPQIMMALTRKDKTSSGKI